MGIPACRGRRRRRTGRNACRPRTRLAGFDPASDFPATLSGLRNAALRAFAAAGQQCGAEVVETDTGSRLGYGAVRYAAAAGNGLSQPSSRPGYGPPARFIGLGGGKLAYGRRSRRRSLYGMICGYTTKRHKYLRICRLVSDGLPCLNGQPAPSGGIPVIALRALSCLPRQMPSEIQTAWR